MQHATGVGHLKTAEFALDFIKVEMHTEACAENSELLPDDRGDKTTELLYAHDEHVLTRPPRDL